MRTHHRVLATLVLLALGTTAWAVRISLFVDTDTFIDRAKDIVIVEATAVPKDAEGFIDGVFPIDINILMTLKGDKPKGKTSAITIYPAVVGKKYLLSSLGGGADGTQLQAIPELSLVPIPAGVDLKSLEGKPLKTQVTEIFKARLDEVTAEQKRLEVERKLLELATPLPRTPKP